MLNFFPTVSMAKAQVYQFYGFIQAFILTTNSKNITWESQISYNFVLGKDW